MMHAYSNDLPVQADEHALAGQNEQDAISQHWKSAELGQVPIGDVAYVYGAL